MICHLTSSIRFKRVNLVLTAIVFACWLSWPLRTYSHKILTPGFTDRSHLYNKSLSDTNKINKLLKLSEFYLFKEGSESDDIRNAVKYANGAISLSKLSKSKDFEIKGLMLKGDCFMENTEVRKGAKYFLYAIELCKQKNDRFKEAQVWVRFGDCISNMHSFQKMRLSNYRNAYQLFVSLGERLDAIDTKRKIGDQLTNLGRLNEAEKTLLNVIEQYRYLNYKKLQDTYDLLASVALLKGDLNKQLYYMLEAIKSMESLHAVKDYTYFYLKLGKIYTNLGSYNKAELYLQKALDYKPKGDDQWLYAIVQLEVDNLLAQHKKYAALVLINRTIKLAPPKTNLNRTLAEYALGVSLMELKHFKIAELHLRDLAFLGDSSYRIKQLQISNYQFCVTPLIRLLVTTKRYRAAEFYTTRLFSFSKDKRNGTLDQDLELAQHSIDSAYHRYQIALIHYKKYTLIRDSIFNNVKNKERIELQFKFESEKKDRNIELQNKNIQLLKKQSQLQNLRTQKSMMLRNIVFVGLFITIMLLIILFRRYQSKSKSARILNIKQIEISEKNIMLQKLVKENELLLKEVHHRVKNNLQIIVSLLESQSIFLKDELSLKAILETQNRIQAMALLHQKLYSATQFSSVYMPEYVYDLVEYIKDSFKLRQQILFDVNIQPLNLDINYAVPLGLIINEVITNAIKHAFPHFDDDRISINLSENAGTTTLSIADNGKGLPLNFDNSKNTFGLLVIKGLTEDLCGIFKMFSVSGTTVQITFPLSTT